MIGVTIDVGGTFTDCLVMDRGGRLSQFKAATTPEDRVKGFRACLEKAAHAARKDIREFVAGVDFIIHGTTMATNALLTEQGAKVGMITTDGFRDELEIRRGFKNIRTSMYNLAVPPYKPLVPRYLRLPVRERTLYTGEIELPLERRQPEYGTGQAKGGESRCSRDLLSAFLCKPRERTPGRGNLSRPAWRQGLCDNLA